MVYNPICIMKVISKIFSKKRNGNAAKENGFADLFSHSAYLTPWHNEAYAPKLFYKSTRLKWDFIENVHGESTIVNSLKRGTVSIGLFNTRVYILPVLNSRGFCIWPRHNKNGVFKIELYFTKDLRPIINEKSEAIRLEKEQLSYILNGIPVAKVEFIIGVGQTELICKFPAIFKKMDDFIMVSNIAGMYSEETPGQTALLEIFPKKDKILVYPQDWYNKSRRIDHGYQWITAAARDKASNRIVVRGIRA